MTQFTCSHHGTLIREKITTYLDAKVTSKRTWFLYEQLIQANTPVFRRGRLYERIKLFSVQHKIGDFHKYFYIQQLEKLSYHHSYYKIIGKHHVADVRHKTFESTPGDISNWSNYAEWFSFEPEGQLKNELFENNFTLSTEGCCLYWFRKQSMWEFFNDNCGGYVHQYNDTVQEFYLNLSDSKLQNSATTKSHIYTLLARIFD